MNITIFGVKTYPAYAGADRVVEKLLQNFSSDNQYYLYLAIDKSITKLNCVDNIHFIYIPTLSGKHSKAFSFFFLCIVHYLIKGKRGILHVHNSDFGFFLPFLRLKRGTKILGTFHGNPYEREKWGKLARVYFQISEYLFVRFSNQLTTVAKSKLDYIPKAFQEKLNYIPNGLEVVELDSSKESSILMKYGIRKKNFFLFACGRLDSTKGLHHALKAYLAGGFESPFLIIGDFSHDKKYSQQISDMAKLSANIILHKELVNKNELLILLSNAELFVFPSEIEAMSMMLLEAISCEVPIVCSDIEENTVLVGDDYLFKFQNKDENDLLRVIKLISRTEGNSEISNELHKKVKLKYDWKTIASQYETIYGHLKNIPLN